MNEFGTYYLERCEQASKDQGIELLVNELSLLGVSASAEQTGGYTMCAYVELKGDRYIYANTYGAGIYGADDDFIKDIYQNESEGDDLGRTREVAQGVAKWIKENN